VLPVYILHLVPMFGVALLVLPLGWPVWLSIAVVWLAEMSITLAAIRWLVRPWRPMRWLVGMNAEPAPVALATSRRPC